jgi:hypothetical protein
MVSGMTRVNTIGDMSHLDARSAIVAMLHDNTELPAIESAGIELAPGQKHKLAYRKRENHFLPPPYTRCTTEISREMHALYERYGKADYVYSQTICYGLCAQVYMSVSKIHIH